MVKLFVFLPLLSLFILRMLQAGAKNRHPLFWQCLRVLDAISTECPDECLKRGVAAAVLQFFDFFSTNKQVRHKSVCFAACSGSALSVVCLCMSHAHQPFAEMATESGTPDRLEYLK